MPDIPRSAIESAIHAENQAAAKRPEQKSLREDLQALWSTFKETPAGHGVMATREQLGNIFDAGVDIVRDAIAGVQREAEVAFWGKPNLAHAPEEKPGIHGELTPGPTPVAPVEHAPGSFDERMAELSDMYPQHDDHGPDHGPEVDGPER